MTDGGLVRRTPPRATLAALLLAFAFAAMTAAMSIAQVRGWTGATNADGVSYLDLMSRFMEGDWRAARNGYWSPLYPMLLAAAQRLAGLLPGAAPPELSTVFVTNVVILTVAAFAFARLSWLLLSPPADPAPAVLAMRVIVAASIGLWSLIRFIGATMITPDGLLAAVLYLVTAELVAAGEEAPSRGRDLRVGALVAAGYWTKAVFFPVAIVAIAAYVIVAGRAARRAEPAAPRPRILRRVLVTALVLALPLVVLQSWAQGRPSFGETGRLNYRWYVGGLPRGVPVVEPVAATRARREPAVVMLERVNGAVLFTGNVGGSFPYWFDPSRFEPAGLGPLSAGAQWRGIRANLPWFGAMGGVLFAFALVAVAGAAAGGGERRWRRLWCALPSVATLALYMLTHVEGRMGAAPLACILLALLAVHDAAPRAGRRAGIVVESLGLALFAIFALGRVSNRLPAAHGTALREATALPDAMRAAGLRAGDAVGVVGEPYGHLWAHQAGTRIVAAIAPALVEESALDVVAHESAARGQPIAAVLIPPSSGEPLPGALTLPGGWRMFRPERPLRD